MVEYENEFEEIPSQDLRALASAIGRIASAIFPAGTIPGTDRAGGSVFSLTEAIMGVTAGLTEIANAIDRFTDVMEARDDCRERE